MEMKRGQSLAGSVSCLSVSVGQECFARSVLEDDGGGLDVRATPSATTTDDENEEVRPSTLNGETQRPSQIRGNPLGRCSKRCSGSFFFSPNFNSGRKWALNCDFPLL